MADFAKLKELLSKGGQSVSDAYNSLSTPADYLDQGINKANDFMTGLEDSAEQTKKASIQQTAKMLAQNGGLSPEEALAKAERIHEMSQSMAMGSLSPISGAEAEVANAGSKIIAPSYEAAAQASAATPGKFGNILNIIKNKVPTALEKAQEAGKQVQFNKIFRGK